MPRQRSNAVANANAVNAVETVAAIIPGITAPANDPMDLEGFVDITTGATTTALVIRIRRGVDATGTVVATCQNTVKAAGDRLTIGINATDVFAGDVANQQYVITVQQTGGSANGTINNTFLGCLW